MSQILTPTVASVAGAVTPTLEAATDTSIKFLNDGRSMLMVANASGGDVDVTLKCKRLAPADDAISDGDKVVTVATATEKWMIPGAPQFYDDQGYVEYELESTTSVTVGVLRIPAIIV